MNVYIYQADLYCEDCGEEICEQLKEVAPEIVPENPEDELYDSDDYPKGPYPDGGGEADVLIIAKDANYF